jgi:2-methylisocitrate lyase-like PEP mutase family enzyme
MSRTIEQRRADFRSLHARGCFVIPNPWDVGSARMLERLGFKALATTSSGHAWSRGRADGQETRAMVLEHLREIVTATDLPVNADFESGYADDPEGVAESVTLAAATGIAGLSIEDSTRDGDEPLYEFDLAVERIRAARQAIDESGTGIVLTGRSEGFVAARPDLDETIRRLQAYAEAGADCLYAPFVDSEQVATIVAAVAPKPVNLLVHKPFITVSEAAGLGVRRISVGGSLARVAQAAFAAAAQEVADEGTFVRFADLPNNAAVNAVFGR